jgi:hypothetical protein
MTPEMTSDFASNGPQPFPSSTHQRSTFGQHFLGYYNSIEEMFFQWMLNIMWLGENLIGWRQARKGLRGTKWRWRTSRWLVDRGTMAKVKKRVLARCWLTNQIMKSHTLMKITSLEDVILSHRFNSYVMRWFYDTGIASSRQVKKHGHKSKEEVSKKEPGKGS